MHIMTAANSIYSQCLWEGWTAITCYKDQFLQRYVGDMKMKKAQVTHLFLQIGTHVSGETTDLWTVEIFMVQYTLLELFYILRVNWPFFVVIVLCLVFSTWFPWSSSLGSAVTLWVTPHFYVWEARVLTFLCFKAVIVWEAMWSSYIPCLALSTLS